MYKITFDDVAKRFLKKLKRVDQKEILDKIDKLGENPFLGKRLTGNLFGLWRLRIDKYRVLYKIVEGRLIVVVLDIGHRKKVYR
jgi:mRNA interferase RelE/StbE